MLLSHFKYMNPINKLNSIIEECLEAHGNQLLYRIAVDFIDFLNSSWDD